MKIHPISRERIIHTLCKNKIHIGKEKYTDEELLNYLKELNNELGRVPQIREIKKISTGTFRYRFGSFRKALEAANIEPNKKYIKKYTDEELLNYLNELKNELGRAPYMQEIKKIPITRFKDRFGSLKKSLQAANIEPNKRYVQSRKKKYTDEYLLNYLKELNNELGRAPSQKEIKKTDPRTIRNRFGSFKKALEAAGIKRNRR